MKTKRIKKCEGENLFTKRKRSKNSVRKFGKLNLKFKKNKTKNFFKILFKTLKGGRK